MISGHLRKVNGVYHIVLNYVDKQGCRKAPSFSTGLSVKGNKKRAEKMMANLRSVFKIPSSDEELQEFRNIYKDLLRGANEGIDKSVDLAETKTDKKEITKKEKVVPVAEKRKRENTKAAMLFGDYMVYWLSLHKNNISEGTYAGYESQISNRIKPYFNEKGITLGELSAADIQEFYTCCMDGNIERGIGKVCANTVVHYHVNIRQALEYAKKLRWVNTNEAEYVTRPKKNQYIGAYYNRKELLLLLARCKGTKLEFPIIMAVYYGMRRSEILGLKWDAIDWERKVISIRHTVTEVTLKGKRVVLDQDKTKSEKSYRALPLIPQVEHVLHRMQQQQVENKRLCKKSYCMDYLDYVCVDEMGNRIRPNYVTTNFNKLLKKHDLKHIRFHDLRHSLATLLIDQMVPMKDIQEWLGHEDITTTSKIYSHYEYKNKIGTAQKITGALMVDLG